MKPTGKAHWCHGCAGRIAGVSRHNGIQRARDKRGWRKTEEMDDMVRCGSCHMGENETDMYEMSCCNSVYCGPCSCDGSCDQSDNLADYIPDTKV